MDFLSNPILLALAGVVGILIGLLLSNLFSESKKPESYELPKELKKDGFVEVARFWYSPAGKRLLSGLDGGVYKLAGDLSPEQLKRMNRLAQLFQDWLNPQTKEVEPPAMRAAQVETAVVQTPGAVSSISEEAPINAQEVASDLGSFHYVGISEEVVQRVPDFTPEAVSQAETLPSEEEIGFTLEEPLINPEASLETEKIARPAKKQLTIVEQIDEILQQKVIGTSLEKRGIYLQDDLHNGVSVFVGGEKFDGIEAVPYPEAQALIHEAVAQWEQNLEARKNPPA